MAQNPNQFGMTAEKGQVDLSFATNNVLSCIHLATENTALVAGQAVKIVDNYSGVPTVEATDTIGETPFGFVTYNIKDADYKGGARLSVALRGTAMHMTASAAIARGAKVQYDPATGKVATATTGAVIGWALDKAGADNALIRVVIDPVTVALGDITNVVLTSPTNGQVLKYDSTDSVWENAADA